MAGETFGYFLWDDPLTTELPAPSATDRLAVARGPSGSAVAYYAALSSLVPASVVPLQWESGDQTTRVHAARDALSAAGGGTIVLGPGVWSLNYVGKPGVHLQGASAGTNITVASPAGYCGFGCPPGSKGNGVSLNDATQGTILSPTIVTSPVISIQDDSSHSWGSDFGVNQTFTDLVLYIDYAASAPVSGSIGFMSDTCRSYQLNRVYVLNFETGVQETDSWEFCHTQLAIFGCTIGLAAGVGPPGNGTGPPGLYVSPAISYNTTNVKITQNAGVPVALTFLGGEMSASDANCVEIDGAATRSIAFVGVHFERNNNNTGGYDVVIGATAFPSAISFTNCDFYRDAPAVAGSMAAHVIEGNTRWVGCFFNAYDQVFKFETTGGQTAISGLGSANCNTLSNSLGGLTVPNNAVLWASAGGGGSGIVSVQQGAAVFGSLIQGQGSLRTAALNLTGNIFGNTAVYSRQVLAGTTTDAATGVVLTLDGAAAGSLNVLNIPFDDGKQTVRGRLIASKTTTADVAVFEGVSFVLARGAGVGSVTIQDTTGAATGLPTAPTYATAALATVAAAWAADTVNGGLALTVHGVAATTIHWTFVVDSAYLGV